MDVAQLTEIAASYGTYGMFIPLIGAGAAGLCSAALLAGTAKISRKSLPEDFPPDGEAARSKFVLPFNQLYGTPEDEVEDMTRINTEQALPAATLCANAFAMYKRANAKVVQDRQKKRERAAAKKDPKKDSKKAEK